MKRNKLTFVILTALFGRIYCSVVCPLGIMQDFFSWLGGKAKKNRFSYAKEIKWLRYGFLGVFILALIIGFAPLTTLFAPYSAYGRIVNSLFKPLYDLLNNWLASLDAANDRYNFTEVQIWTRSVTTFVVALLAMKWFVNFLTRYGFKVFGLYRIVVGLIIIVLLLTGHSLSMVD